MSLQKFFSQPVGIQWRKALGTRNRETSEFQLLQALTLWAVIVSLPRAVPTGILRYTSPEGPQPTISNLPSRGKYLIPIHLFVPTTIDPSKLDYIPVIIDFHGGSFCLGSCLEQAPFCAKMARDLGCIVMTVDYRMGPIDKFPAAVEDAEDVLSAVLDPMAPGYDALRKIVRFRVREALDIGSVRSIGIDKSRIAISGFSSGGNIALNLALSISPPDLELPWPSRIPRERSACIPILLYYPSFDARTLPKERTCPPGLPVPTGFFSDLENMLMPTYLPRDQAAHPRASPGLVNVSTGLHEQARILLVLPELDSLSEQSEIWVKKVEDEGRDHHLVVERFKGMKHGWTQMPSSFLSEIEKKTTAEIFEKTVIFVRSAWEGTV